MPERQILLEAAEKLEKATRDLGDKFERVDVFSHETRSIAEDTKRLSRWLAAGLVAVALVVALLAWVSHRVDESNDRSTRNQEYQVASCLAANETRAAQRALWAKVIEISTDADDTKAERRTTAEFLAYVNTTFAERDCTKVAEGKVR